MQPLASSYRDPAGFVFTHADKVYRFISPLYAENYALLYESGLYQSLTDAKRLIRHEEISDPTISSLFPGKGTIILPEQIPFISYPYEWSFDMWRDAALLTLKIAAAALEKGMILKDATPFNIQFFKGRPVFIDTLSFEKYTEGEPWVAYRQFCECFLGPLLLMHYGHRDAGKLLMIYPEGIPLDVIKDMLPPKSKWNLHVYMHIRMQAKMAAKSPAGEEKKQAIPKHKSELLLKGLISFVKKLKPRHSDSEWNDYYSATILGEGYLDAKKKLFEAFTGKISFRSVIDLGANDGFFSFSVKDKAEHIVATDFDSNCINALYSRIRKEKISNIIPLVSSLHHPSPSIGWAGTERDSLTKRLKADLVLALALVHHLAIGANIPFEKTAEWFSGMGEYLIIEFVPKDDEKVQQLLKSRKDIFSNYDAASFRKAFEKYYEIKDEAVIGQTGRILFLMKRKLSN